MTRLLPNTPVVTVAGLRRSGRPVPKRGDVVRNNTCCACHPPVWVRVVAEMEGGYLRVCELTDPSDETDCETFDAYWIAQPLEPKP